MCFTKNIDFLDTAIEPYLIEFNETILQKNKSIQHEMSAKGLFDSGAYFNKLKDILFDEISATTNKIFDLVKDILESQGISHKIKPSIAKEKMDQYLNKLIEESKNTITQMKSSNPSLVSSAINYLDSKCNNFRNKLHTNIDLFLNTAKSNYRKNFWLFKATKYLATYFLGILSIVIANNSHEIFMYFKKWFWH